MPETIQLTKEERKEVIHKLQLKEELDRRIKINGIKWFTPTGKQEEFTKLTGSGECFVCIFSAANASGKTALMANILGGFIFGPSENPFLEYPLFKNFPHPHRGRIVSTPKNLEEIGAIQTEIKKYWPVGKYEAHKRGRQFDSEYIIGDWVVDLMSYEQAPSEFEAATLGVAIFDEPPPEKILYATIARMRKGGIILIFMTPLDNGGEIIEDLTNKESVIVDGKEIGKVGIVYAEIEDSCKGHGARGFLEHSNIVQMLSFYDPEEIDARAKGKPVHLTGRIYSDFEYKNPYVVDDFVIPDDWDKVCILDPHDGIPFALSWVAIDKTGQLWIYDEFPFEDLDKITSTNLAIPDYARVIREKEGRDSIKLRLADPYFVNKRYANTGKTIKEELSDLGLDFEDGDTSGVDLGHKRVREYLKYQKAYPVSSTNHPKLHILQRCRNHWRSFLRYKRKLLKSGEVKDKIVIEETYKHFCDNIRHLVMKGTTLLLNQPEDSADTYKVVGEMKDVRYSDSDDGDHSSQYQRLTQGAITE